MSYLQDEWYYFLADNLNRTCSWVDGGVVKNAVPTPLPQLPKGWKDIELKFGTNIKYWSLNRSFSTPLTFINDGANIIRWYAYTGKGSEEELYVLILHLSKTSGLYELEYKGKIDFSKMKDDPYVGVTVNTLEGGALRYLNANDNVTYEIPCDGRNPNALKVLFDGVTLSAKYNYSAVNVTIQEYQYVVPITLLTQSGDSVGIIGGSQSLEIITNSNRSYFTDSTNYILKATETTVLSGVVQLRIYNYETVPVDVQVRFLKNTGEAFIVYVGKIPAAPVYGKPNVFSFDYNIKIELFAGERIFFEFQQYIQKNVINLQDTQIILDFTTKKKPSTAYALRPVDSGNAIVEQMSNGLCSLESDFLSANNNVVASCGDALRNIDPINAGVDGYNIKSSFADWFSFYNSIYNLGIQVIGTVIKVEPKGDLYNDSQEIFDLGEASDFSIEMATEQLANSVKAGYPDMTYQGLEQNNGKLEFNSKQEWSIPITAVNKPYDIASKWNAGCFGIEYIRNSYLKNDASYNESDNGVYAIEISDETAALSSTVPTALPINITATPSKPIIRNLANNEIINNDKPTISGYGTPGANVGILIDTVQEGYVTVDSNGFWSYNIVGALAPFAVNSSGVVTFNGQHVISAAFADSFGVVSGIAPLQTITVTIYLLTAAPFLITSPANNDYLYNNKPIIKGTAVAGNVITISVDGSVVGTATANGSCKWEFQITSALSDRVHTISAVTGTGIITISLSIRSTDLAYPLITNYDSGVTICDNLPLIQGVGTPNSNITLYLDFNTTTILGTAVSDNNGDWSYQVTVVIADGLHYISTTAVNQDVNISVFGHKLFRENYDAIYGVYDNTIFNRRLSPRNQIIAHGNVLRSIALQQLDGNIKLVSASKNRNLITISGPTINAESEDIIPGDLEDPLFVPYNFNLKVKISYAFERIMQSMQTGYLSFTVKGYRLYALPIGTMSMKPAMEESQVFKLLAAPNNSLSTFLLLSESILFIQDYKDNMISISNLNPLQFIKFNYTVDPKYQQPDIFDKPFFERYPTFINKPFYLQPWQQTDSINLQIITAGLSALTITMYDSNANQVSTQDMTLRENTSIKSPYVLQEISMSLASVAVGEYKVIVFSGTTPLAESEWFFVSDSIPGSVLIEYSSSYNKLNGYFDSWAPMIRVQGTLMPGKPDSDFTTYEDELKDVELLHAIPSYIVPFVIGKPFGIPDWMATKINEILLLNRCNIEGVRYTRSSDSKMEESALNGYPMSYYKTTLRKAINNSSLTIVDSSIPGPVGGLMATLDGAAFGQAGSVIQITIDKE